jgi:hypothetical protein
MENEPQFTQAELDALLTMQVFDFDEQEAEDAGDSAGTGPR